MLVATRQAVGVSSPKPGLRRRKKREHLSDITSKLDVPKTLLKQNGKELLIIKVGGESI
jgi:hypothetical protein